MGWWKVGGGGGGCSTPPPQVRDTAGSGVDSDRAVVTEERMTARWGEGEVAMVEEVTMEE